MARYCPFCGKDKLENSIFCSDCVQKVENKYGIELPGLSGTDHDLTEADLNIKSVESTVSSSGSTNSSSSSSPSSPNISSASPRTYFHSSSPVRGDDDILTTDQELRPDANPNAKPYGKHEKIRISPKEKELIDEINILMQRRKKNRKGFITILITVLLLSSALFLYNKYVINQNLERASWESSKQINTLKGYLDYMNEYPNGVFFSEAQAKMMDIKDAELVTWENIKHSDNTSEIQLFIDHYPLSPFRSMALNRLDSLMWNSSLNVNSVQSYSDYMIRSDNGELPGGYYALAQQRYEMLFQSYPISEDELSRIKLAVDGFFIALSSVDYSKLNEYLAPTVYRFFNSGKASRDKIISDLLIAGAKSNPATIKFIPQLDDLQYQKTYNDNYKTSVPLSKSFVNTAGIATLMHGYIVHIEMDSEYRIIGIYETKPFDDAI